MLSSGIEGKRVVTIKVGHHKETDQVAKIIKKKDGYAVYLDKDLVGTVKTIKEARVLANEKGCSSF